MYIGERNANFIEDYYVEELKKRDTYIAKLKRAIAEMYRLNKESQKDYERIASELKENDYGTRIEFISKSYGLVEANIHILNALESFEIENTVLLS